MNQQDKILIDYLALLDVNPENFVEEETKNLNNLSNMNNMY